MRGLEADPSSRALQDALEDVSRTLTLEQVSQVSTCLHTTPKSQYTTWCRAGELDSPASSIVA